MCARSIHKRFFEYKWQQNENTHKKTAKIERDLSEESEMYKNAAIILLDGQRIISMKMRMAGHRTFHLPISLFEFVHTLVKTI